jgi:uncharacterized membrane protein YhiD involved in acid resistance
MTTAMGSAAVNLLLALLLGAIIGFERQWRQRLAGLRTNTLVALGSATFVVFESLFPNEGSPTRVAAQVVSGIGGLQLRRLDSANIEDSDRVEVTASGAVEGRPNAVLEQIVGRLSLEPAVTAARWRIEQLAE